MIEQALIEQEEMDSNVIQVKSVTWNKDSHGLFDYQSKNCTNAKFKFKLGEYSILRNKLTSEISILPTEELRETEYNGDYTLLTTIFSKKENGETNYYVSSAQRPEASTSQDHALTEESLTDEVSKDGIYLIVRSLKKPDKSNRGHDLDIGEKIKLGRVQFSVIEMKIDQKKQVSNFSQFSFLKNESKFEDMEIELDADAACKVCMETITSNENFLFSPCKCTGSCKYIHLTCLQNWMISKVKKEIYGGTAYYHFDKFQCEICKSSLPKFVVKNGEEHELLGIERPEGNYLILEQCGENKKDLVLLKNIHPMGIGLGRGHQCDIRVNDISVSRQHALMKLEDNKFTLFDQTSKFGTLVKLNKNIIIDGTKKAFQIGRTVLTFTIKKEKLDVNEENPATANLFYSLKMEEIRKLMESERQQKEKESKREKQKEKDGKRKEQRRENVDDIEEEPVRIQTEKSDTKVKKSKGITKEEVCRKRPPPKRK